MDWNETRRYVPLPKSTPPASVFDRPRSDELVRMLMDEGILPVASDETIPNGAVLIQLNADRIPGGDVKWVVLFDEAMPEALLCDALCDAVLEYMDVAGADEGGWLRG